MIRLKRFFLPLICVGFICSPSRADRGDLFLSVMPVVDPFHADGAAFGGGANLSMGVNERTDFQLETDLTVQQPGSNQSDYFETRYLLASFFTPYFGEIRPRFGGSMGLIHSYSSDGINEVGFNAGVHLQGLYDFSQSLRFFAEANPNISFGKQGGFSTLFKLGIQFRLSK